MPLTNEEHLRMTLDSLFYRDRIKARLKTIGADKLRKSISDAEDLSDEKYLGRILAFIKEHFVGYSISHVDGRFRSDKLLDQDAAAKLQKKGLRYLIDETTAVTRFIFPYRNEEELNTIRHLFQTLFVRSIIQLVNGEEQIWMVESGPQSRVHIWHASDEENDEEDDEE